MKKGILAFTLTTLAGLATIGAAGGFAAEEEENPCRFVCVPNCAECEEHLRPE